MSEPRSEIRGRGKARGPGHKLAIILLVTAALAACAPGAEESRPVVALMNAPAEATAPGAAETVQDRLQGDLSRSFDMVSAFTMRFLESHTDLFRDRAAPSAARIARDQSADLAVMIGAPVLEREVTLSRDEASRRIDVSIALEAQVVDPNTEAVVQTLRTRTHQGSRVEANDAPLPEAADDSTVAALVQEAAPELARSLAAELPFVFKELLIGVDQGR